MESVLVEGAASHGVRLQAGQVERLNRYVELIAEWSSRVNLVSDATPDIIVRRHILESIALGAMLREREVLRPGARVLDLGAGAGLPGIVLDIVWPGAELVLLEATRKKTEFLERAVSVLGLTHARVITGRAEDVAHEQEHRATYDLVVARAVAPLRVLAELALPFARVGGRLVTPKGSRVDAEVAAATEAFRLLGGRCITLPLNVTGPPQTVVVIVKQQPTPDIYPRRAGVPARRPL